LYIASQNPKQFHQLSPFDVVAIAAGALRIPLWQFVLAFWLGRTILYVSVLVLVALGWDAVVPYLG